MLMAIPRKIVQVRLPVEAYDKLGRLCAITKRSQAQLIEILVRNWESAWLDRFTAEERETYLSKSMTFEGARKILQRAPRVSPPPQEAA
jgi:hypothetical protein